MPQPNTSKYERKHKSNLSWYERQVDLLYREAITEACALAASLGITLDDTAFTFDDYPQTKKRIEKLLRQLQNGLSGVLVNGVKSEWTLANNKNNELSRQVFGSNVGKLSQAQYRRLFSTNGAARDAFLQRREAGMNLSDRVWNYTQQFKAEMEQVCDLGIRNGQAAEEMQRSLQQYLRHPDNFFRRYRYKEGVDALGNPIYKRKWKKRYFDEATQSYKWKDVDLNDYRYGAGVYRSSYKNARRLAVTETNIAYRTSDHMRWQQMDFVVGIRISCSDTNHPIEDICDELAGDYPKTFKFTGWHPHCRCHATSILKTDEEMQRDTRRILNGEEPLEDSVNAVKDTPPQYKRWVERNAEKITKAKSRGKLPYFLQDNEQTYKDVLEPTQPEIKPLTPQEIAKARHEARTPEQRQAILDKWNERRFENLGNEWKMEWPTGNMAWKAVCEVGTLMKNGGTQEAINEAIAKARRLMAILQQADARHAARTPAQRDAIVAAWNDRKDWNIIGQRYDALRNYLATTSSDKFKNLLVQAATAYAHKDKAGALAALKAAEAYKATLEKTKAYTAAKRAAAVGAASSSAGATASKGFVATDTCLQVKTKAAKQELHTAVGARKVEEQIDAILENCMMFEGKGTSGYWAVKGQHFKTWAELEKFIDKHYYSRYLGEDAQRTWTCVTKLHELGAAGNVTGTIPNVWVKQYNALIKKIEAFDFSTGYSGIRQEIEFAHNILKLSQQLKAAGIDPSKVSIKMPYNVITELGLAPTAIAKEFFDNFDKFVPLFTTSKKNNDGAYFTPSKKLVVIDLGDKDNKKRLHGWYSEGLVYHEYGHALDNDQGWRSNAEVRRVWSDYVKLMNAKNNATVFRNAVAAKLKKIKSYTDEWEQLGALTDCMQAAINGHSFIQPLGHTDKYFYSTDLQIAEFIAHCSECYWKGNPVLKDIDPALHKEMMGLMEKLLKVKKKP